MFPLRTRRELLADSAALSLGLLAQPIWAAAPKRPRVAVVFTELRLRSHAYNILENFIEPYLFNGELIDPGCEVVSFYVDQYPELDMAREVSRRFKIPIYRTIDEALCCGTGQLAVDAVLIIAEHGDYPYNEMGQHLYPRKEFFDQSVAVMHRANRYVPVFNDKHLSYRWDWAREMYDTARKHNFPLLAGSSVPLAERRPAWELPANAEMEEVVSVHGGKFEVYDFHAIEVLQAVVEGRRGGETGVAKIETLTGDALRKAAESGRWSEALFQAAMQAERDMQAKRQQRPRASLPPQSADARPDDPTQIHEAILIEYRDGLKATALIAGSSSSRWNFACRLKGEAKPHAFAHFNGPWGNRCLFKALSHAIQHLFIHRQEPYPAERTLLTTGMTSAAVHSHFHQKPIETPELNIAYQVRDWRAFRESGASWQRLTVDTPEPQTFEPGDAKLKLAK